MIQTFSETVPAYRKQAPIERESWVELKGIFRRHNVIYDPYTDKNDQLKCGDGRICVPKIHLYNFDVKGEERSTLNAFIEIYSNRSLRSEEFPEGRLGWYFNLTGCHVIPYYVKEIKRMYFIHMARLRALDLSEYNLVPQKKNEQSNDTWGIPVAWRTLDRRGCLLTEDEWLGRRS